MSSRQSGHLTCVSGDGVATPRPPLNQLLTGEDSSIQTITISRIKIGRLSRLTNKLSDFPLVMARSKIKLVMVKNISRIRAQFRPLEIFEINIQYKVALSSITPKNIPSGGRVEVRIMATDCTISSENAIHKYRTAILTALGFDNFALLKNFE